LAQLDRVDERVQKRRAIFDHYRQGLENMPGITFLPEPEGYYSNRWLTAVTIDPDKAGFDAEAVRLDLEQNNIESRHVWKPMHLQPVFQSSPAYGGSVASSLFEGGLCLPSGSKLNKEDLDRVLFSFFTLHHKVFH